VSDGSGNPLAERSGARDCSAQHDRVYHKLPRNSKWPKRGHAQKKNLFKEIPYQSEANHEVVEGIVGCGIEIVT
jgi:hypothetical protein